MTPCTSKMRALKWTSTCLKMWSTKESKSQMTPSRPMGWILKLVNIKLILIIPYHLTWETIWKRTLIITNSKIVNTISLAWKIESLTRYMMKMKWKTSMTMVRMSTNSKEVMLSPLTMIWVLYMKIQMTKLNNKVQAKRVHLKMAIIAKPRI